MRDILDLVRFPLDEPDGAAGRALIRRCRDDLDRFGMFDLDGLVRPAAVREALAQVEGLAGDVNAGHVRRHGVYPDAPPGVPDGHAALARVESSGTMLDADRLGGTLLARIYGYPPLAEFLARVLGKPRLHPVPTTGLCVMRYAAGEAAGWHFDRTEFKVTLVLQAAQFGGIFEYARDLRSDTNPNAEGVAALLAGSLPIAAGNLMPGTLNLFRGRNTAHRVTPVGGDRPRIIAELVYDERPATFRLAEAGPGPRPGRHRA